MFSRRATKNVDMADQKVKKLLLPIKGVIDVDAGSPRF
jgi:hypothetical protein